MAFYNEKEQLYIETDAIGVGPGASFLQVRVDPKVQNIRQCSPAANSTHR